MDGENFVQIENEGSDLHVWRRRHLHTLYRETLQDYRQPGSDWMKRFSRTTLSNIWESYRETRT